MLTFFAGVIVGGAVVWLIVAMETVADVMAAADRAEEAMD